VKVKDQYVEGKIQFIDKVCKERFNTYPYYHWIGKHVVSQLEHRMQRHKFQHAPANHNLRFILIAFTTSTEDLN
jgi:hypothetical protein